MIWSGWLVPPLPSLPLPHHNKTRKKTCIKKTCMNERTNELQTPAICLSSLHGLYILHTYIDRLHT